jgi:hypothetical protein
MMPLRDVIKRPILLALTALVASSATSEAPSPNERGGWARSVFDKPYITGQISERVTVSTEIEFAALDFAMSDRFTFRGGIVLSPLGSFNVLHDSPLNDLTARPVVTRQLIPTTLSEAGMGFYGTFYPGEQDQLDYQTYLVNGFDEGIISGEAGAERLRVRGGRGSQKADNNDNKAVVARLGYSPRLGTVVGVSAHTGAHDDSGEHDLTIAALDLNTTYGPLEFQGEVATVSADIDRSLYPVAAESQRGAYAQVNYHILHDSRWPVASSRSSPAATGSTTTPTPMATARTASPSASISGRPRRPSSSWTTTGPGPRPPAATGATPRSACSSRWLPTSDGDGISPWCTTSVRWPCWWS